MITDYVISILDSPVKIMGQFLVPFRGYDLLTDWNSEHYSGLFKGVGYWARYR